MDVLVSDTSVLIDLDRAGLRDMVCRCGHRFVIPDLMYQEELAAWEGPAWCAAGLELVELGPDETALAQAYFATARGLSLTDSFALALSRQRGWILLTGDLVLRECARAHGVACHGLLWVVDLFLESGQDPIAIAEGLVQLLEHPRCRLSRPQVEEVIERLRAARLNP